MMSPEAFQALALALREAGAVKVRAGDLEVIWPGPLTPSMAAQTAFTRSNGAAHRSNGHRREETPAASPEEARLRAFQRELSGEDD